jgi:hypothetical protein
MQEDKIQWNEKRQRHGHWLVYYTSISDNIWYIGNYINGVEYGYEMSVFLAENGKPLERYYAR